MGMVDASQLMSHDALQSRIVSRGNGGVKNAIRAASKRPVETNSGQTRASGGHSGNRACPLGVVLPKRDRSVSRYGAGVVVAPLSVPAAAGV